MPRWARSLVVLVVVDVVAGAAGCAAVDNGVSLSRARAHVAMLADTIGSRPLGSNANAAARRYLVDELEQAGFDVRVQQAQVRLPAVGLTASVANIIAVAPGAIPDALGLVAHYDSVAAGPGAGDNAFGAALAVEAGRTLAAETGRRHTVMVLLTDGEEAGLLGAHALLDDPDVAEHLRTYVNLESIGTAGPAFLFETGPEHGGPLRTWARAAPAPRGASFALEIYRRLPRDTDFSVFRRAGIPGLNFALVGNSYAYHTDRDTADRIADRTLRRTGANVVATLRALDRTDWTGPPPTATRYFDLAGVFAVAYGDSSGRLVALLALLLGAAAWWRVVVQATRLVGLTRLGLAAGWAALGAVGIVGAMVVVAWTLRGVRDVLHPWYAHPAFLVAAMLAAATVVACGLAALAARLRLEASSHPLVVWSIALPCWVALAGLTEWAAPAAAFLWTVPLLGAGAVLMAVPRWTAGSGRMASAAVALMVAAIWAQDAWLLLGFLVTVLGRQPIVTPVWILPAYVALVGVTAIPPLAGLAPYERRWPRRSKVAGAVAIAAATAFAAAYLAPAYSADRPLRAAARYVQLERDRSGTWEVGANEPTIVDAVSDSPLDWTVASDAYPGLTAPTGRLAQPFVYQALDPGGHPLPASISASLNLVAAGSRLRVTVIPSLEATSLRIVLPPGVTPLSANWPGTSGRNDAWSATRLAVSATGATFDAVIPAGAVAAISHGVAIVETPTLPGSPAGGLPPWLARDRVTWRTAASYIVPLDSMISSSR
ncbi:MAG: M28 family peptidase [Vicinamibacterales bacterium]|nr:M28 family peptidase [Vicinamibacterales bacterium]MDP6610593.1 M28 family peptidase [Vicinamibacterales bacterium]HAK54964.1 hypothetical protein [Acidobacteriota bacterium]|tara:strand:+ start:7979 stop:10291 length:2313 start_codon:yes stop_codon:yes gene_type:complete